MKKSLNEIKRMQQLAGLIKEGNNAIDPLAPSWDDYEGYEILLEQYFDTYDIVDKESLESELENGDMVNNLAMDILKRKGVKISSSRDYGAYDNLMSSSDNMEANKLAKEFIMQYAEDMGIIE
jgi:hypothetical protein